MNARTAAIAATGERRISARRAEIDRAKAELRAEISRLVDAEYRLIAENRRLTLLVVHQQRLLDRAEPARVSEVAR